MKMRLWLAALAATGVAWLAPPAQAGCVIAPDGKSINVVTDNPSSDEKNCAVSCKVDTKIGVVQVSCGGNTPPLAKAHSLCDYDKPEAWYKKVISSEDSCKGGAAAAAPAAPAPVAAVKPGTFICRISADGHSFDAMIANPYKVEASCLVNCQVSTTVAGTTVQSYLREERRARRRRSRALHAHRRQGKVRESGRRQRRLHGSDAEGALRRRKGRRKGCR